MRTAVILALAFCGLAGCMGGDGSATVQEGATATTGILRGVVFDDAVRPLSNVAVIVEVPGASLNATTGADGLFSFTGLKPGAYLVEASKPYYSSLRRAVVVEAGVDEPELARFQLAFEASSVPSAQVYKYEGFYECGLYLVRVCSNVNILTRIVVCANTGICIGDVTPDRSLLFQVVEPGLSFLQTELHWKPTNPAGQSFGLLIGGGTEEELKEGVGLPAYNGTHGPSPLMLRISNHEGPDAWCVRNDQCEGGEVLNESKIGTERALLVQIDAGATVVVAERCGVPGAYEPEPCGVGLVVQQPFQLFTTAFYGYEPPEEWLFVATGEVPPPPGGG